MKNGERDKKSKHKTSIKKKTLNPVYDEEFRYNDSKGEELFKKSLEVTVWDHDLGSYNDFIGSLNFGIDSNSKETRDHWIKAFENPNMEIKKWHVLQLRS